MTEDPFADPPKPQPHYLTWGELIVGVSLFYVVYRVVEVLWGEHIDAFVGWLLQ